MGSMEPAVIVAERGCWSLFVGTVVAFADNWVVGKEEVCY